jgi:hypothetical protein
MAETTSYDKSTLGKPLFDDPYTDRVAGSLLGTACGDILGVYTLVYNSLILSQMQNSELQNKSKQDTA